MGASRISSRRDAADIRRDGLFQLLRADGDEVEGLSLLIDDLQAEHLFRLKPVPHIFQHITSADDRLAPSPLVIAKLRAFFIGKGRKSVRVEEVSRHRAIYPSLHYRQCVRTMFMI